VKEGTDGFAYCQKDYVDKFGAVCAACGELIVGQVTEAIDKKYHPEHFRCANCEQSFEAGKFFPGPDGKPYCER